MAKLINLNPDNAPIENKVVAQGAWSAIGGTVATMLITAFPWATSIDVKGFIIALASVIPGWIAGYMAKHTSRANLPKSPVA